MAIIDELERLAVLHSNGALTDEEFVRAKAALIGNAAAIESRFEAIERKLAILRLDDEWSDKRHRYYGHGRQGLGYVPLTVAIVVAAVVANLPTIIISFQWLLGISVTIIVIGCAWTAYEVSNAVAYENADRAYRKERNKLM